MKIEEYLKIVNNNSKKENKNKNYFIAFFSGGILSLICELIYLIFTNLLLFNSEISYTIITCLLIIISSVLTGLGLFDELIKIFKCGLLIPITGFAHSITSAALDDNDKGLVYGIGTTMFKLGGTVIIYGVVFSIILVFVKGVFL